MRCNGAELYFPKLPETLPTDVISSLQLRYSGRFAQALPIDHISSDDDIRVSDFPKTRYKKYFLGVDFFGEIDFIKMKNKHCQSVCIRFPASETDSRTLPRCYYSNRSCRPLVPNWNILRRRLVITCICTDTALLYQKFPRNP